MSDFNVSTRYANALMEFAESKGLLSVVSTDIELISNTLAHSKRLRKTLASPIITDNKKISILDAIFGRLIDSETFKFLKFILSKHRENILFHIVKRFLELRNQKEGKINITITSAYDLLDEQKKSFVSKLELYTDKKVLANYQIDKKLIGGFLIKIGDRVIDASVVHQLELLRKKLRSRDVN